AATLDDEVALLQLHFALVEREVADAELYVAGFTVEVNLLVAGRIEELHLAVLAIQLDPACRVLVADVDLAVTTVDLEHRARVGPRTASDLYRGHRCIERDRVPATEVLDRDLPVLPLVRTLRRVLTARTAAAADAHVGVRTVQANRRLVRAD